MAFPLQSINKTDFKKLFVSTILNDNVDIIQSHVEIIFQHDWVGTVKYFTYGWCWLKILIDSI